MQFIFSTGSLHTYSLDRCFDFAAQAGFDGIELMVDHRWDTQQREYLQRLVDRHGLPIVAVHSPFAPVPGWPGDQPGLIKSTVNLAEALGAQIGVHHLPERAGLAFVAVGERRAGIPIPGWDKHANYRPWLLDQYPALQEQTAVRLCIENLPAKRWLGRRVNFNTWNTGDEICRFPALTLDTTHLATWGLEPLEVYRRWQTRVQHVHLSNYNNGREHRRPETGQLRLDRFPAQLAADGYQGAIPLELHPDSLDAGKGDQRVGALMANSLATCRRRAVAETTMPAAERALAANSNP